MWRVRRRGEWLDATLAAVDNRWRVTFTLKGRALVTWEFETRDQAKAAAEGRLREFERAGWNEHW
jgi:hypothetical protein